MGDRILVTSPISAVLLMLGAVAWFVTFYLSRKMNDMAATMSLGAFLGIWTTMMSAMMLPAVAPVATAYQRMIRMRRLPATCRAPFGELHSSGRVRAADRYGVVPGHHARDGASV